MPKVRYSPTRRGPILANRWLRVALRADEGTLAFANARTRWAVVPLAFSGVVFADGSSITTRDLGLQLESVSSVEDVHGQGQALRLRRRAAASEPDLSLSVTLYEDQPYAILQCHLGNTTGRPLHVQALHVLHAQRLRLGPDAKGWRFYKQGWQNWSPTLILPCDGEDIPLAPPVVAPTTRPPPRRGRFLSELVTAIVDPQTSLALTAGFISSADQFSQLWLDRSRRSLTAASYADGIELPPGETFASERLLLDITSPPPEALPAYGDALARQMKAASWPHLVSGWCSWYYYWQGVSEADIIANLQFLAEHQDELPLEYVQIDDGWQAGIGDWRTANAKFPHGMAWLADRIHGAGFKAGLWLAPFLMGGRSHLYAQHPDWSVQYRPGRPYIAMRNWEQDCYALDTTRPEVIAWLEDVFATVCRDWGYDYLKVDFLYAAAVDGLRHDPNVTRAQAYRRGLAAIRRAAADKFILGCGNPVGPSVGLINGMRIGPDVAPYWTPPQALRQAERIDLSVPATFNAIRNVLHRWWMHRRLWLNDPDCLLARDSETALTAEEVGTLAAVIAMSGGMLLDSDNLSRLPPERRRIVAQLLPLRGEAAVPLDLFQGDLPQILWRAADGLLALFNWRDEAADITVRLPTPAARITDFWTGEDHGVQQGAITFRALPPHASKLLVLTSPDP